MRVKHSTTTKAKHKSLLKLAKGYRGPRKHSVKLARQATLKAGVYAYRDRRNKKRVFRASNIISINAALGAFGLKYSTFIYGLKKTQIDIDRKILSDLGKNHPNILAAIVDKVK